MFAEIVPRDEALPAVAFAYSRIARYVWDVYLSLVFSHYPCQKVASCVALNFL